MWHVLQHSLTCSWLPLLAIRPELAASLLQPCCYKHPIHSLKGGEFCRSSCLSLLLKFNYLKARLLEVNPILRIQHSVSEDPSTVTAEKYTMPDKTDSQGRKIDEYGNTIDKLGNYVGPGKTGNTGQQLGNVMRDYTREERYFFPLSSSSSSSSSSLFSSSFLFTNTIFTSSLPRPSSLSAKLLGPEPD